MHSGCVAVLISAAIEEETSVYKQKKTSCGSRYAIVVSLEMHCPYTRCQLIPIQTPPTPRFRVDPITGRLDKGKGNVVDEICIIGLGTLANGLLLGSGRRHQTRLVFVLV